MSLIKCSECGKEISDKASSCPQCGCPINIIQNKTNENITSPIENNNINNNAMISESTRQTNQKDEGPKSDDKEREERTDWGRKGI